MHDQNQLRCIKNLDENMEIIACAGAGKTSTMVARLLNILDSHLALPSEIIAITFTEKAAGEFKERIFSNFEKKHGHLHGLSEIKVGTIHSFCLDMLKEYYSDYKKYDIISEVQAKLLIKKEFNPNFNTDLKDVFLNIPYKKGTGNNVEISKNQLQSYSWNDVSALLNTFNFIREENIELDQLNDGLKLAYKSYINLLSELYHFDYSGIQFTFFHALKEDKGFQDFIVSQFKYIFIDEYQDINTIQNSILRTIHAVAKDINICVVGDDDQLIYSWRGSNVDNFLHFKNQFQNSINDYLNINYRSSEGVVRTAETVVTANKKRFPKLLNSNNTYLYEQGDILSKSDFKNVVLENEFIVKTIKKLYSSTITDKNGNQRTIGYDDIAILVYSPGKLRDFNIDLLNKLSDENIPYVIEGTKKLLEQEEILDIIRVFYYFYVEFLCDTIPAYEKKNYDFAKRNGIFKKLRVDDSAWSTLISLFKDVKGKYFVKSTKATSQSAKEVYRAYDFTIQEFFQKILITLKVFNLESSEENDRILYNLASFSSIIDDFEKIYYRSSPQNRISQYLSFLEYDVNNVYPEGWLTPNFLQSKSVRIMSIHKAKGLEFPVVFMPYLCEQYLFPPATGGGRSMWGILEADNLIANLDELKKRYKERNESLNRLFYVGVTRSEKYLFMTKSNEYEKPNCKKPVSKIPQAFSNASKSSYVSYSEDRFLNRTLNYCNHSNDIDTNHMVFDFTTINDFFECPYKFKLNSVIGFKSPVNVRMGYGQSLHNILEEIHKTYYKEQKILNTKKDIKHLVDKHLHLPLGNHLPQLMIDTKQSAIKVIENYLAQNSASFPNIELVEQRVDFKMNDSIFINGRVDLVKNNKSGEIIVVDFKSSDDALSSDSKNAQLEIYALGYHEFTGNIPTAIHSYALNTDKSIPTAITIDDLQKTKEKIMELQSKINNNVYEKIRDSNPTKCNDCCYVNSCKK